MGDQQAHEDMVQRILSVYDRATNDQRLAGIRWYPMAGRIVDGIAAETETPTLRVARCLAALSPRNPWMWNIQDAYAYASAYRHGEARPSATTFEPNRVKAWQALAGEDPFGDSPKVRAFVAAILGDREAVVVDVWAYRVATGAPPPRNGSFAAKLYPLIAAAYEAAAAQRGQDPRDMQAITWIVAQTEGLASERRGRHDLKPKAGTGTFVLGLLALA